MEMKIKQKVHNINFQESQKNILKSSLRTANMIEFLKHLKVYNKNSIIKEDKCHTYFSCAFL